MTTEEYQIRLCKTLIDRFTEHFFDKTGRRAFVHVPGVTDKKIQRPALSRILFRVEQAIPITSVIQSIATTTRKRSIVTLKQIFCKIARDYGYSYKLISRYVYPHGDHTDVLYSKNKAADLIAVDDEFKTLYENILNKIHDDFRTDQSPAEEKNNPEPVLSDAVL